MTWQHIKALLGAPSSFELEANATTEAAWQPGSDGLTHQKQISRSQPGVHYS